MDATETLSHLENEKQTNGQRWQWAVIVVGVAAIIGGAAFPFLLREYTASRYGDLHYAVDDVPDGYRIAVVFGARVLRDDRLSTILRDRVAAAIDLYEAGKVDVIIMSGDGRTENYNEPRAMRAYAISRGVPASAIVVDEAGLRTYDTCYRTRDVFQVDQVVLVTQDFHLDRALYLCNSLGVDAVGVPADYQRPNGYTSNTIRSQQFREVLATTAAFLDLLTDRDPQTEIEPNPVMLPLSAEDGAGIE